MNQILDFNDENNILNQKEEKQKVVKQPKNNAEQIMNNQNNFNMQNQYNQYNPYNPYNQNIPIEEKPELEFPGLSSMDLGGKKAKKENAKTLLKVFTIIMILFAMALSIYAVYSLIQNKKLQETNNALNPKETIKINIEEINGKIKFSINSENEIDKVVYLWNDDIEKEQLIQGEGRKEIVQENIEIPKGDNRFKVSVIDKKGNKKFAEKEFKQAKGNDINKPVINFKLNGNLIELDITDDVGIQDVKYKWEDETEEKTAVPPNDNKKQLKLQFTTKEGERVLKVTATDTSGNSETVRKNFVGLSTPKIKLSQTSDRTSLEIEVEHSVGISKVEYSINGKQYKREYQKNDPNNKKVVITQLLDIGDNVIQVRAQSVEGIDTPLETGNANRPAQTQRQVQPPSGIQNRGQDGSVAPQLPNLVTN